MKGLISFTDKGIYCAEGGFYIDPWKPVDKALVTHAHADHARWGSKYYLAHKHSVPVMRLRLGEDSKMQAVEYNSPLSINGVKVSFHPAGHIIGSAQIRLEHKGEICVVSGDYKTGPDRIAENFEAVKCHTFVTESTFGLPVYKWTEQEAVFDEINEWWKKNKEEGKNSLLLGYSLGKAQRLLAGLDVSIGQIFTHGAVYNTNEVLMEAGIDLPEAPRLTNEIKKKDLEGALILAPPSAAGSTWVKRLTPFSTGMASGWMSLRGAKRRRAADRGFVLSDHADWKGLNQAIADTGAENIIVTHGYTQIFAKWLREQGYNARAEETLFDNEGEGEAENEKQKEEGEA